ncbi:MAG: right-handed parallel beta-helix repeat-containing protein [Gammaproteobacteria bacterium]|nr:right-handed parallel beta-helix repeat-containing protein [Gammaproteobacteria bacterium]
MSSSSHSSRITKQSWAGLALLWLLAAVASADTFNSTAPSFATPLQTNFTFVGPDLPGGDRPRPYLFCDVTITQADVDAQQPYVMVKSGRYCLAEDITVSARLETFRIAASNVELWFAGRTLSDLTHPWADTHDERIAIAITEGVANVWIHGGTLRDFEVGIRTFGPARQMASGKLDKVLPADLIRELNIEDMTVEVLDLGFDLDSLVTATIANNTMRCPVCMHVTQGDGVTISDNVLDLDSRGGTTFGILAGWAMPGLWIVNNTIRGEVHEAGIGIYLSTWKSSGGVVLEKNTFSGLDSALWVYASDATGHTIRHNTVHGGPLPYTSINPPPVGYQGGNLAQPYAMYIGNTPRTALYGNAIFSAAGGKSYDQGIVLFGHTTIRPQANGRPALYDNETCGTQTPLVAPVGVPLHQVEDTGNNSWESCRFAAPQ